MNEEWISTRLAEAVKASELNISENGRNYRRAAVLIPMFKQYGDWHLLFTRRSDYLQSHSGQVAFPGGGEEPQDTSPEMTALREAQEEIGLRPNDVRLLGRGIEYETVSNYLVTPVVGRICWPYPLILQPDEVVRAFSIPLNWLADANNWEIRPYERPDGIVHQVVFFHEYDGEILWGITARITVDLVQILSQP